MPTLGIIADEGKPSREVARIIEPMLTDVHRDTEENDTRVIHGTYPGVGPVEVRVETLPMTPDGDIHLNEHAEKILGHRGWDRFIYVTDLPLTAAERPIVSQRAKEHDAVLISLPALGMFGSTGRLRKELTSLIEGSGPIQGAPRSDGDPVEGAASDDSDEVRTRVLDGPVRNLRMVAGMVRGNQPGHLIPVLSSSLAAIAATGGFGIFYGSIWVLAEEMTAGRLILVSLLAVTAFATWLIIHNRLWQRSNTQETRWRERIDNLATIGTIGMTAILIYLLAFAVMLIAATVVIPVAYLESELERDVGYLTYISIAWLSASLGTMAGALGSNFDRDVEIRSATYNLREYQRRTQQGNYVELDEL